jgi:hypothetical protein
MAEISIQEIHNELKRIESKMVTKEDIEPLIDTIEIMGNTETIRQIAESMQDIKSGKVKEVFSVKDLMSEI